jgi:hypothetical protein
VARSIPGGWPVGVHPPGSDGFEDTAVKWLLEVVPGEYRQYDVLRRYPAALALLARHHTAACAEGARQGYRTVRTDLGEDIPLHAIDEVLRVYRSEGRRLAATARATELLECALRGKPPRR